MMVDGAEVSLGDLLAPVLPVTLRVEYTAARAVVLGAVLQCAEAAEDEPLDRVLGACGEPLELELILNGQRLPFEWERRGAALVLVGGLQPGGCPDRDEKQADQTGRE
eukprot:TRINITY_DN10914_c0_g1_i5.p3 TRINITY_DN10914_c0_g1~~TRINITY_DN10914_c0_g1_i5.p3  ORF type:complete len:108 (+),score=39.02 TRINITY_DN10914_c0_g1_i5:216-539(+)